VVGPFVWAVTVVQVGKVWDNYISVLDVYVWFQLRSYCLGFKSSSSNLFFLKKIKHIYTLQLFNFFSILFLPKKWLSITWVRNTKFFVFVFAIMTFGCWALPNKTFLCVLLAESVSSSLMTVHSRVGGLKCEEGHLWSYWFCILKVF
jgi:hypothetical protein